MLFERLLELLCARQKWSCGEKEEAAHVCSVMLQCCYGVGKRSQLLSLVFVGITPLCAFQLLCLVGTRAPPLSVDAVGTAVHGTPGRQSDPRIHLSGVYFGGA